MINAACQVIIFLYLLDNETSYVILFSSGVGAAIEIWKVRGSLLMGKITGYGMLKGKILVHILENNPFAIPALNLCACLSAQQITKAMDVSIRREPGKLLPTISIKDR